MTTELPPKNFEPPPRLAPTPWSPEGTIPNPSSPLSSKTSSNAGRSFRVKFPQIPNFHITDTFRRVIDSLKSWASLTSMKSKAGIDSYWDRVSTSMANIGRVFVKSEVKVNSLATKILKVENPAAQTQSNVWKTLQTAIIDRCQEVENALNGYDEISEGDYNPITRLAREQADGDLQVGIFKLIDEIRTAEKQNFNTPMSFDQLENLEKELNKLLNQIHRAQVKGFSKIGIPSIGNDIQLGNNIQLVIGKIILELSGIQSRSAIKEQASEQVPHPHLKYKMMLDDIAKSKGKIKLDGNGELIVDRSSFLTILGIGEQGQSEEAKTAFLKIVAAANVASPKDKELLRMLASSQWGQNVLHHHPSLEQELEAPLPKLKYNELNLFTSKSSLIDNLKSTINTGNTGKTFNQENWLKDVKITKEADLTLKESQMKLNLLTIMGNLEEKELEDSVTFAKSKLEASKMVRDILSEYYTKDLVMKDINDMLAEDIIHSYLNDKDYTPKITYASLEKKYRDSLLSGYNQMDNFLQKNEIKGLQELLFLNQS